MIICITENSPYWDAYGIPYLIDTSKLDKASWFRKLLEETTEKSIVLKKINKIKPSFDSYSYHDWFTSLVYEDIQQAIVEPPQMVDKLLSIVFE